MAVEDGADARAAAHRAEDLLDHLLVDPPPGHTGAVQRRERARVPVQRLEPGRGDRVGDDVQHVVRELDLVPRLDGELEPELDPGADDDERAARLRDGVVLRVRFRSSLRADPQIHLFRPPSASTAAHHSTSPLPERGLILEVPLRSSSRLPGRARNCPALDAVESAIRKFVSFLAMCGTLQRRSHGSMGCPRPVCAPDAQGQDRLGQEGGSHDPTRTFLAVLALAVPAVLAGGSQRAPATAPLDVPGLEQPASVVRDSLGIPHVFAQSDHDAYFLVGWLHAQDRLFQMDQSRRQASGTLAELLGSAALPPTCNSARSGCAARPKVARGASPAAVADLEAYSAGVNAYVTSHPLPPEYTALELTSFPPWTPLDSVAVGKLLSFGLAFETNDIGNTQRLTAYRTALGAAAGTALAEDVMRIEPFAHAPSILPGETSGPVVEHGKPASSSSYLSPSTLRHAAEANASSTAPTLAPTSTPARTSGSSPGRSPRRAADGRERPAPRASVAVDVLRARDPCQGPRPLRCHLPGTAVDRPRPERAHRLGLDRQSDRRDGRLPGVGDRLQRRPGGDDVPRLPGAHADLPPDLPREPAGKRHRRRPRHGAAVGERAAGRRRDEARAADRAEPERAVDRLRDPRGGLLP